MSANTASVVATSSTQGERKGAGRRPGAYSRVPHTRRPKLAPNHPVHLTLRLRREVWSLRSHRCFRVVARALSAGCTRFGFRLVHFSIAGNQVHIVAEAPDEVALGRGAKGLEVRMARALNRVMRRTGPVFADRYAARALQSPRIVRQAVLFVLHSYGVQLAARGVPVPADYVDPCCSAWPGAPRVASACTWLLTSALRLRASDRPPEILAASRWDDGLRAA